MVSNFYHFVVLYPCYIVLNRKNRKEILEYKQFWAAKIRRGFSFWDSEGVLGLTFWDTHLFRPIFKLWKKNLIITFLYLSSQLIVLAFSYNSSLFMCAYEWVNMLNDISYQLLSLPASLESLINFIDFFFSIWDH